MVSDVRGLRATRSLLLDTRVGFGDELTATVESTPYYIRPVIAWQTSDVAIGARQSLTAVPEALTMRGHDHGPYPPKCHAPAFPLCLVCGVIR